MPASAQTAPEVTLGKLTLRVRGPAGVVQTVVLTAECCRIGSGEGCTLRLRAPGIRDVHCVISRGPKRTVVRGLTKEAWLNGAVFFESPLVVGDCLRVGTLEIDVLTDERIGGDAETTGTNAASTANSSREGIADDADRAAWAAETVSQLQQLVAEQTADVHATAADAAAPERPPSPPTPPEVRGRSQDALPQQEPVQAASQADVPQPMRRLEDGLGDRLARLEDQSRHLERFVGEVGKLQSAWETESRQRQTEQEQAEAQRRESLANLDRRINDLNDAVGELGRQTQALIDGFHGLQTQPAAAQDELQRRLANLETQWAAAASRVAAGEGTGSDGFSGLAEADRGYAAESLDRAPGERSEAFDPSAAPENEAELAFEPVSREAPLSTLEVLRRMGASVDFADDEEAPLAASPTPSAAISPAAERAKPLAAAGQGQRHGQQDDGDSIEQYMSQLLGRMRAAEVTERAPQADPPPAAASADRLRPGDDMPTPPVRLAAVPWQLVPRAPAPELIADFSAMRALANNTARQAIDTHRRRRQVRSTRGKLLVAAVALVLSFALLWVSTGGSRPALWSAVASMLVSVYWGGRYIRLKRQLRGKPDRERSDDAQQASEQPTASQTDDRSPVLVHAESLAPAAEDAHANSPVMDDSVIDRANAELLSDAQLTVADTADRPI